ncbi:MAG: ComEC/Rec2 family competence protein [Actinobacteria bacterium]|nr:ComEC/Rec2 family competence protein [Actinomycetota bacterium]
MSDARAGPRSRLQLAAAIGDSPRHIAATATALGLALSPLPSVVQALAGAAAALALLACGARAHVALIALTMFVAAGAAGQARLHSIDADPLAVLPAGVPVALRGELVERPRPGSLGGSTMRLRVRAPGGARQLVEVRSRFAAPAGLSIGDGVVVRGSLARVSGSAGSPAARSYARYLLRNGVRRRVAARSVERSGTRRGGAFGFVDSIRRRSERALAIGLSPEPAALLRGMVLGGDDGIPEPTADAFRVAGLSHILAVSGQNVLLLVILVQAIATASGMGRRPRLAIAVALICVYVPLCGAQASVVRAGAMGLAGLAAMLASTPASRGYALLLGAIAVLGWNPRATADVGAQLSFAAVLGIVAFSRPLTRWLKRWPAWVAEGFAVTAGATLATAPLMAHHFGTFSAVSLAANVIGGPLIGPIVWLGSLAAAIGQLSAPLGALLNAPNGFLLGSLITLAHTAAAVPGAQLQVPSFGGLTLAALALPIVFAGLAANGLLPRLPAPTSLRSRRAPLLCAIAIAAATLAWLATPAPVRLPRPSIVFLDVGQGDATLLLGSNGCSALIDGGPPGRDLPARLARLGVRRLDMVLATHPQLDHDGGLGEIASAGRPAVRTFLDGGGNTTELRFDELRSRLAAAGVRSSAAIEGAGWTCGDLRVDLLGPRRQSPGAPPPADPNTRAAVTVVRAGPLRMLAAGDAESPQLLALALPPVDLLKVSHHGSADDGLPVVLSRIRPRVAAIGVGDDNHYGHPTAQALGALAGAGVSVFRTDRDGTIAVSAGPNGEIRVRRHIEGAS